MTASASTCGPCTPSRVDPARDRPRWPGGADVGWVTTRVPRATASPSPAAACPAPGCGSHARQRARAGSSAEFGLRVRLAALESTSCGRRLVVVCVGDEERRPLLGRCAAAAATSGSSPRSSCTCTRSGRSSTAACSGFPARCPGRAGATAHRDFMLTAPDQVGTGLAFITAPPEDFVPEPVGGSTVSAIVCAYVGVGRVRRGDDRGPSAALDLGVDMVSDRCPTSSLQQLLARRQPRGHAELLDGQAPRRPPRRGDRHPRSIATESRASPMTATILGPGGGALARVDDDAMAFGQRQAPWNHAHRPCGPTRRSTRMPASRYTARRSPTP